MKNLLRNIDDSTFNNYLHFSKNNNDIVSWDHMLQKLILFDFVVPILEEKKNLKILEIGCGLGIHSCLLSNFGEVYATELKNPGSFVGADENVENKRNKVFASFANNKIEFSYNNGDTLPYPDNLFDVVYHNSVIEHVPDIQKYLDEIFRVLKPKGITICITGTQVLCVYRIIAYNLVLLPIFFCSCIARGKSNTYYLRERIKSELDIHLTKNNQKDDCQKIPFKQLYPQLFHFYDSMKYNFPIIEKLSEKNSMSEFEFLECFCRHYERSIVNRIKFFLTFRTHGQHNQNVISEMNAWRLTRWETVFKDSHFSILSIQGYRFHHFLEFSYVYKINTLIYFYSVPLINKIINVNVKKKFASEIIIVARKP